MYTLSAILMHRLSQLPRWSERERDTDKSDYKNDIVGTAFSWRMREKYYRNQSLRHSTPPSLRQNHHHPRLNPPPP